MKDLSYLSLKEKKKSLLFIPHSISDYWQLNPAYYKVMKGSKPIHDGLWPFGTAFIAPTITGIALLEGMPPLIPPKLRVDYMERALTYFSSSDAAFIRSAYIKHSDYYILKNKIAPQKTEKLISILSPVYKKVFRGYGFNKYRTSIFSTHQGLLNSPEKLNALAKEKGFEQVIIIEEGGADIQSRIVSVK